MPAGTERGKGNPTISWDSLRWLQSLHHLGQELGGPSHTQVLGITARTETKETHPTSAWDPFWWLQTRAILGMNLAGTSTLRILKSLKPVYTGEHMDNRSFLDRVPLGLHPQPGVRAETKTPGHLCYQRRVDLQGGL